MRKSQKYFEQSKQLTTHQHHRNFSAGEMNFALSITCAMQKFFEYLGCHLADRVIDFDSLPPHNILGDKRAPLDKMPSASGNWLVIPASDPLLYPRPSDNIPSTIGLNLYTFSPHDSNPEGSRVDALLRLLGNVRKFNRSTFVCEKDTSVIFPFNSRKQWGKKFLKEFINL